MDDLGKSLIEHFESEMAEPNEGHFERFEHRLRQSGKRSRTTLLTPFFKVAAVLVIILLSANLFFYLKGTKLKDKTGRINNEVNEASFYYTGKINKGIRELESMAKAGIGTPTEIMQVKKELSEMDSLFVNLQQEYRANPNDERIINAMIEYYQSKLDIVNTIKTDLENVQQLKKQYHENIKM